MLNKSDELDRLYHALADSSRRAMIARLADGPTSVTELARPLPMSLPAALQHLQVLEQSGLIMTEKAGRVRTCRLAPGALAQAERWLSDRRTEWEARLDRLEAFLADTQSKSGEDT